jgi:hypothetical protein
VVWNREDKERKRRLVAIAKGRRASLFFAAFYMVRASLNAITCVLRAISKSHDDSSYLIEPVDIIDSD